MVDGCGKQSSKLKLIRNISLPHKVKQIFHLPHTSQLLPSNYKKVHENPTIYIIDNFLNSSEYFHIDQICSIHYNKFKTSVTEENNENNISLERTSTSLGIPKSQDHIIARLEQRISDNIGLPAQNIEPLQIVSYTPGQKYDCHHDAGTLESNGEIKVDPPRRLITIFLYLNSLPEGQGETHFPKCDMSFTPHKNKAIMFCNFLANGVVDPRVVHEALPITIASYRKFGVNIFITDTKCEITEYQDLDVNDKKIIHRSEWVSGENRLLRSAEKRYMIDRGISAGEFDALDAREREERIRRCRKKKNVKRQVAGFDCKHEGGEGLGDKAYDHNEDDDEDDEEEGGGGSNQDMIYLTDIPEEDWIGMKVSSLNHREVCGYIVSVVDSGSCSSSSSSDAVGASHKIVVVSTSAKELQFSCDDLLLEDQDGMGEEALVTSIRSETSESTRRGISNKTIKRHACVHGARSTNKTPRNGRSTSGNVQKNQSKRLRRDVEGRGSDENEEDDEEDEDDEEEDGGGNQDMIYLIDIPEEDWIGMKVSSLKRREVCGYIVSVVDSGSSSSSDAVGASHKIVVVSTSAKELQFSCEDLLLEDQDGMGEEASASNYSNKESRNINSSIVSVNSSSSANHVTTKPTVQRAEHRKERSTHSCDGKGVACAMVMASSILSCDPEDDCQYVAKSPLCSSTNLLAKSRLLEVSSNMIGCGTRCTDKDINPNNADVHTNTYIHREKKENGRNDSSAQEDDAIAVGKENGGGNICLDSVFLQEVNVDAWQGAEVISTKNKDIRGIVISVSKSCLRVGVSTLSGAVHYVSPKYLKFYNDVESVCGKHILLMDVETSVSEDIQRDGSCQRYDHQDLVESQMIKYSYNVTTETANECKINDKQSMEEEENGRIEGDCRGFKDGDDGDEENEGGTHDTFIPSNDPVPFQDGMQQRIPLENIPVRDWMGLCVVSIHNNAIRGKVIGQRGSTIYLFTPHGYLDIECRDAFIIEPTDVFQASK